MTTTQLLCTSCGTELLPFAPSDLCLRCLGIKVFGPAAKPPPASPDETSEDASGK